LNTQRIFDTDQKKFGRLPALDPRDRGFRLSSMGADPSLLQKGERQTRMWLAGPILDQGGDPHCVEYSIRQMLGTSPIRNKWAKAQKPNGWLYSEAQKIDEWPGEAYDGTSVRAGFKILLSLGLIKSYGWAWTSQEVAAWVLHKGPMVVGTDWYSGMSVPTSYLGAYFLRPLGSWQGGHAWAINGCDLRKPCPDGTVGAFRMVNSWGRGWADEGVAWVSLGDMQRLLSQYGEACTAIEEPMLV
jgi:hypothetical protein